MKLKKCKCGAEFEQFNTLQVRCIKCAIELGKKKTLSDAKKVKTNTTREIKTAKEAIKTRSDWMRDAQTEFNKFIRARDGQDSCISCGTRNFIQYHAGHYRTTKAAPELRFNELNCHKQCSVCNNHLSGNLILYRKGLIKKIGIELVEYLEGQHPAKHYSIDDLKRIKAEYKLKLKDLGKK